MKTIIIGFATGMMILTSCEKSKENSRLNLPVDDWRSFVFLTAVPGSRNQHHPIFIFNNDNKYSYLDYNSILCSGSIKESTVNDVLLMSF